MDLLCNTKFVMHTQKITIRPASREDAETIADLSRVTFYETFAPANKPENMEIFLKEQFTRESLVEEVRFPTNTFFLAFSEKKLAGYVKLRDRNSPKELKGLTSLEIARIYATTEMIGKGVGKKLMETSIELAAQKMKQAVWLAVWEKNQRAIDFYTSWGFEVFSKQVFVLGNDLQKDWLMKKLL